MIVPTFNRARQIVNLLTALEAQTFHRFETIVVDDGSSDNTVDVLHDFAHNTQLDIKTYSIPNKGRAGSRNFGITKSSGELLIFFDDDTRPNPDAIRYHYQCHLNVPNALISGPYLYDRSRFVNDFNYFREWMESKWTVKNDVMTVSTNLRINGGNFSIRKDQILKIGGFDERLRDKEDFKLAYDMRHKVNGDVLYFYRTWVYHDDFRGLRAYIEREAVSRREEQKLCLIDPAIGHLFPERFVARAPMTFKHAFGRMLRLKFFVFVLEKVLNIRMIKRSFRYKLYDAIITMNVRYFQ